MGSIGLVHLQALAQLPGVMVAAISTRSPERGREVAARFGIPRIYPSHQALVDDPQLDAVHICTPNHEHFPLAKQALERGKHVICEKPLTATQEEAETLAALAAAAPHRVHAVAYQNRFFPMVEEARRRVEAGDLGALYLIHGHYLQDWLLAPGDSDWRVDPGQAGPSRAFADIGTHWCDAVEYVTGETITRVSARMATVIPGREAPAPRPGADREQSRPERAVSGAPSPSAYGRPSTTEDVALIQFETDRGTLGSLVVSQVSAGHGNELRFELNGARASLAWSKSEPGQLWLGLKGEPCQMVQAGQEPGSHLESAPEATVRLFAAVYRRVRQPALPPAYPTFQEGLHALDLVAAVVSSARQRGAWVTVPWREG